MNALRRTVDGIGATSDTICPLDDTFRRPNTICRAADTCHPLDEAANPAAQPCARRVGEASLIDVIRLDGRRVADVTTKAVSLVVDDDAANVLAVP
ncbi:hypothetical protein GCM10009624_02380 [Gordonia sinesedis]